MLISYEFDSVKNSGKTVKIYEAIGFQQHPTTSFIIPQHSAAAGAS